MHEKIAKLRELKLLFVEDEKDLLDIISDTLKKLQANFLTATNGAEALELIKDNKDIDVVITDINMPVMDGLEMIREIRKEGSELMVIIMSAHTEIDYIEQAKEFGVHDYLLKPFDFIKFINLITNKS